jgi:hypothetical protein
MSAESSSDFELEIAHVLFMDVVGYSKLLVDEQREVSNELNQVVRSTQQFRNAEAAGEVTLKRGSKRQLFRLRALSDQEKPEILKAYLNDFRREVQRYFPVPAGSPAEAFRELVQSYPAFELIPS